MFLSLIAMTAISSAPKLQEFYIGTYTSANGSQGIYHASLNLATGEMTGLELAAKMSSPSYLTVSPNHKVVYAVDESSNANVSVFSIQEGGKLSLLNAQSYEGGGPCHVSTTKDGKLVFAASYGGGTLAAFPTAADGSLLPKSAWFKNTGSGPDKGRQEGPHMHSAYSDSQSKFVYACDLGTDDILVFKLDKATGSLTSAEPRATKAPAGGGPRHLAFHPSGKFAFVNNEMPSTVTAYSVDPKSGGLAPLNTVSTLPPGTSPKGTSTAEIAVHPSGKWLYVSNRGHDSIATYHIENDGHLALLEISPAGVQIPRGFGIEPSGKWMIVAGQNSNDLVVQKIDPKTGLLNLQSQKVKVSSPVCIAFR